MASEYTQFDRDTFRLLPSLRPTRLTADSRERQPAGTRSPSAGTRAARTPRWHPAAAAPSAPSESRHELIGRELARPRPRHGRRGIQARILLPPPPPLASRIAPRLPRPGTRSPSVGTRSPSVGTRPPSVGTRSPTAGTRQARNPGAQPAASTASAHLANRPGDTSPPQPDPEQPAYRATNIISSIAQTLQPRRLSARSPLGWRLERRVHSHRFTPARPQPP